MFALYDTFNNRIISRHRTIAAAAKGKARFLAAFYRNNSRSSYIPITVMTETRDGELSRVSDAEFEQFDRAYCTLHATGF